MSGQEVVDELRAFIPGVSDMGTLNRAADRIEAQAKEIAMLRETFSARSYKRMLDARDEQFARAERAERQRDAARLLLKVAEQERDAAVKELAEAHTHFAIQEGRIRQAYEAQDFWRQRAAELEALLDNGDPAYTTRIREETARAVGAEILRVMTDPDRVRPKVPDAEFATDLMNDIEWAAQIASDLATRPWSEIPEVQTS